MATWQHLRSSTANKRPTTSLADGRIAINTNTASPGLFFKDSAGTGIVKVGPVHVGTTAPNASPAAGGSTGNYTGEQWLDTSVSPAQMKVWNGSTWVGIVADELPVSKLQDGAPRQLIQTDAAGTGVEWTSNVDVPGTLDVTSTATFDSIASHPLGSAGAPTITFTGDTNTGIYSPGPDQLAISTNGTGRLFVGSDGVISIGATPVLGGNEFTVSSPDTTTIDIVGGTSNLSRLFFSDTTTARGYVNYDHSDDSFRFGTAASERLRITSDGKVGLGTSTPSNLLHASQLSNTAYDSTNINVLSHTAQFANTSTTTGTASSLMFHVTGTGGSALGAVSLIHTGANAGALTFATRGGSSATPERMRIDSSGRVGVGTTTPGTKLSVAEPGATDTRIRVGNVNASFDLGVESTGPGFLASSQNAPFYFFINNAERVRIDSSGRLLVGTSSARTNVNGYQPLFQVETAASDDALNRYASLTYGRNSGGGSFALAFNRHSSTTVGGQGVVAADYVLGQLDFNGSDGTNFIPGARIQATVDGTPGANDMPGRLVFSTTADGASSPTERMRINQAGGTYAISTDSIVIALSSTQSAGTTNYLIDGKYSGTAGSVASGTRSFRVFTNGNVENTNNSYTGLSDIKLKENIVDAGSQWDDLKALQVRKYNFKEGQTHTQIGLVAQEVELVSPGLVSESPDRDEDGNDLGTVTKSVNYSVLYMKAVKALQEAMERIEQLETEMAAVKTQLS